MSAAPWLASRPVPPPEPASNARVVTTVALKHYEHLIALYEDKLRGGWNADLSPLFEARLYEMKEARRWLRLVAEVTK